MRAGLASRLFNELDRKPSLAGHDAHTQLPSGALLPNDRAFVLDWHIQSIPKGLCKDLSNFQLLFQGRKIILCKSENNSAPALHPEIWDHKHEMATKVRILRVVQSSGQGNK